MAARTLCPSFGDTPAGGWLARNDVLHGVEAGLTARSIREQPSGRFQRTIGKNAPVESAVRVWDSTAEVRYLVLPMRPEGTEDMDEAALAALVSRDAMIGTALVAAPKHSPGADA